MIDKIVKLLEQLEPSEIKHIHEEIEGNYGLGEILTFEEKKKRKRVGMLRDDIRDRVFDLIKAHFTHPNFLLQEHHTWTDMTMDSIDMIALSEMIIVEFDLDGIEFAKLMEWQRVSDVVNYTEDALESRGE